jgi:hypothetical protein
MSESKNVNKFADINYIIDNVLEPDLNEQASLPGMDDE